MFQTEVHGNDAAVNYNKGKDVGASDGTFKDVDEDAKDKKIDSKDEGYTEKDKGEPQSMKAAKLYSSNGFILSGKFGSICLCITCLLFL